MKIDAECCGKQSELRWDSIVLFRRAASNHRSNCARRTKCTDGFVFLGGVYCYLNFCNYAIQKIISELFEKKNEIELKDMKDITT